MANKVNVEVQVTSNIDEQTRSAKVLRKELEGAQKSVTGASGMAKAASETKTFATAAESAASSSERLGYGIARAAAGTGAAGRDFAKQAQGLGGLVHVYATFAANLFAVGAAFTALKNAADTTNMIKGLDQLGAASGRGLGTLSKEIVTLTDGAVTLREAMEATAKATAAGMSSEDLKRLATGAKNASQALGVDMSDALSRLSRGITKLEPELLDELGIFVRVDKAAADYARTLGKPASALTDFEKRAGFAAATLEQVEKKFGDIKIDSNPYNQLLSSLKGVMQTGLEVINTFLEPVLRLLAASPTGLAVALAAVGAVLLKQAIPALGSFRESMKTAAEEATRIANVKAIEASGARRAALTEKELLLETKLDDQIAKVLSSENKLGNLRTTNINKNTAAWKLLRMAEEDVMAIEEKHYEAVEKSAKRASARGDEAAAATYREIADSVRDNVRLENELAAAKEKHSKEVLDQAKAYTTLGQVQRIADRANQEATKQQIVSNAAYTASIEGPIAALRKLKAEIIAARKPSTKELEIATGVKDDQGNEIIKREKIATKGLTNIQTAAAGIRGAFSIATTAVGTFLNAFGTWAQVISLLGVGLGFVIDHFSNTEKESKATAEALTQLAQSGENVHRVMSRLATLDPLERLNIQSIQARSTALTELAQAVNTAFSAVNAEVQKMSWVDSLIDGLKSIFGADIRDNFAEELSQAIVDSMKLATEGTAATSAKKQLQALLGNVEFEKPEDLKRVLEPLIKGGPIAQGKVKEVVAAVNELSKAEATTAARGTELIDSIKTTDKAFQDLFTSMMPQDAMSKLGQQVIQESFKMSAAAEEPVQKINILKALLENPSQQALLSEETRQAFINNGTAISGVIEEIGRYDRALEDSKTSLKKLEKVREDIYDASAGGILDVAGIEEAQRNIDSLKSTIKDLETQRVNTVNQLEGKGIDVNKLGRDLFQTGANLFAQSIVAEAAKGASILTKAIASTISDTKLGSDVSLRADNAQLEMEKNLIRSQALLAQAMYENTAATQLETATREKQALEAKTFKSDKDQADLAKYVAQIDRLNKSKQVYESSVQVGATGKISRDIGTDPVKKLIALKEEGVSQELITLQMQLQGAQIQFNNKGTQQAANMYVAQIRDQERITKNKVEENNRQKETNSGLLDQLNSIQAINSALSPQLLTTKQNLELKNLQLDNTNKVLAAEQALNTYTQARVALGEQNNKKYEEEQGKLQKNLDTANELKKISEASLKSRQALAQSENEIAIKQQMLALDQQRLDAIGSLGIIQDTSAIAAQGELERQLVIQEQLTRKLNLEQQIAAAQAKGQADLVQGLMAQSQYESEYYAKKLQTLEVMNRVKLVQAETNELANSLNAIFTGMNNSVGEFASTTIKSFESMQQAATKYSEELAKNEAQKKKVAEDSTLPEDTRKEKLQELADEESKLKKKSIKDELTGNAAILGSAKKLFNEKSAAYRILANVEKAMHIAKLGMMVAEMVMSKTATASAVADDATKTASNAAVITTNAGAAITNQGKGEAYSAFARIAAMTALMTAVIAAFAGGMGGGSPSVSVPSMPTAEQYQEVQGTGQDYQAGTLNLLANGGGVLGDIAAKSEDIANSIDYMESYSFETLIYNNKMLTALKGIEVNTSQFVASLAQAGIIGINSPFGTQATSSGGGSGGFLGIGGSSSSTSTDVTDFGVKITGALGDLIKGLGQYLVYETTKTVRTSSSSGFWGIGGSSSTSTSYATQYQNLQSDVIANLQALFINASNAVLASADTLGTRTVSEIQNIIEGAQVNLDISTFGLTGEEALADVMAEIGVELNKVVAVAYPFLTEFQRLGEGLTTTLARVTTDMQTVDIMFKQMGTDFVSSFLLPLGDIETANTATEKRLQDLQTKRIEAEAKANEMGLDLISGLYKSFDPQKYLEQNPDVAAAGVGPWQHYVEYGQFEKRAMGATKAIFDAYKSALDEELSFVETFYAPSSSFMGIGGTGISDEEVASRRQQLVVADNLKIYEDLINKFGGELETFVEKSQFYIDNFVDQNTVLMAHYDTVNAELTRLDEQFPGLGISLVDTKREFVDLVKSLDLATESGRQLYVDLMNLAPGFDVISNHIEELISSAGMAADDFAQILMDSMSGSLAVSDVGEKVATTIKDGILEAVASSYVTSISTAFTDLIITPIVTAVTTGATLTNVISAQAITEIKNIAIGAANAIGQLFKDPAFVTAIQEATSLISGVVEQLAASTQITTGSISKIIAKYNAKMIDAYKKQASEIQNTLNKFKGFSDSLKEFRDSLLTGALSPLTPAQKYQAALDDLNTTYAKAMQGDETAIARLKSVAQTFLDMSREYYASSDAYISDFDRVQGILDSTIGIVDSQVSDLEKQLQVAQDQLAVLGYIDETAKSIEQLLQEAQAAQREEVGNVLSTGFTSLDKNFDGLLTMEELRSSGLASDTELRSIYAAIDTNGDGQISMLEALKSSTEGTTFSVNSLAPILEGIKNGTLSVKEAIDYLAELNKANVGAGGTPINVDEDYFKSAEQTKLEWVQEYVQGAYRDILNREAESSGLQYWTSQILSGNLAIQDLYSTLSQSDEAINNALQARVTDLDAYITRAYTMLLDRARDVEGFNYWKQAIESNAMSIKDLYAVFSSSDEYLRNMANTVSQFNSIMSSVGSTSYGIPGFASGGYHSGGLRVVGENGPELEATGEARIWTAQQTQQMLNGTNARSNSNNELIAEIQRLNQKIDSLERTVQQGDIMNMQATERNTQQVSTAVVDSASKSSYATRVQNKAAIV